MKHVIKFPDGPWWDEGTELRTIIWDDEAGTVEGDHSLAPVLQRICEDDGQDILHEPWGYLLLDDVRHNPQHFLSSLCDSYNHEIPSRAILPDSLKDIEPLSPPYEPPPPGGIY